jgi:glucokinase
MTHVPVLEVGGTHATASEVEPAAWTVRHGGARVKLRGDAPADELLDALARCAGSLPSIGNSTLAVAMPGPFDYAAGIGRFHGVGKFDALDGLDVGSGLLARLSPPPARVVFANDAAAFGLGEWVAGEGRDIGRLVALTLGTGVGSAFVADGAIVADGPTVPPEGYVYRLDIDGRPLESMVSRRAILARYREAGGADDVDVRELASRAQDGESRAREAFVGPIAALGTALAPWLTRFGADMVVVGGAMSRSWSLVGAALSDGMHRADPPVAVPVRKANDPAASTAIGAAWHAVGNRGTADRSGT